MSDTQASSDIRCSLIHHGAAANSVAQAVTWLRDGDDDEHSLAYASHAVVNLARRRRLVTSANDDGGKRRVVVDDPAWQTHTTLRTGLEEGRQSALRITALTTTPSSSSSSSSSSVVVTGFSNGSVTVWSSSSSSSSSSSWREHVIVRGDATCVRSVTALAAEWLSHDDEHDDVLGVVVGSSDGAAYHELSFVTGNDDDDGTLTVAVSRQPLTAVTAVKSVAIVRHDPTTPLVLVGTAAPRHNRIHVYTRHHRDSPKLVYAGGLSGHEDWITCMDYHVRRRQQDVDNMLATGSQDARIRLWRFVTTLEERPPPSPNDDDPTALTAAETTTNTTTVHEESDSDEDIDEQVAAEEEQAGEARLEMRHYDDSHDDDNSTDNGKRQRVTRVFLEALLLGHEDMVTDVTWYRQSQTSAYDVDLMLLSSSMDRSILLWTPSAEDGIWTPLTRVGSAGGILGGSVGSTLLGYLSVSVDPSAGTTLVGHAYGGSLHTWQLDDSKLKQQKRQQQSTSTDAEPLTVEDRASMVHWRAKPCVTGHFGGVVDLSWETSQGAYLVSVSTDQTCRLWAPVDGVWLEIGRPQVHGYDLTAVASLSTSTHPHLLVTAADEKELRAFDAPRATITLLQQTTGLKPSPMDAVTRVDRAYIPSLGLSNKASAAESAEEEKPQGDDQEDGIRTESLSTETSSNATTKLHLPLERDLGAVTLWPETRKLFGHQTELYRLTSTLAAQTAADFFADDKQPVLVASSGKARDVTGAAIRLWDVARGTSHQVLQGGHKSTVATLAFSPCGTYLASSGKDRRLCLWKRNAADDQFSLAWARDGAHKRIVWSVHFCPWHPTCLVSGSRDGCIRVWQIREDDDTNETTATVRHSFAPRFTVEGKPDAVTALSFRPTPYADTATAPTTSNNNSDNNRTALLAVGLESGRLELWTVPLWENDGSTTTTTMPQPTCVTSVVSQGHRATVTKLAWKPQRDTDEACTLLASGSLDHGVRIWKIDC